MKLICGQCQAECHISNERVGRSEALVRCTRCQQPVVVSPSSKTGPAATSVSVPIGADPGGTTRTADTRMPVIDEAEVICLQVPERRSVAENRTSSGFRAAPAEWFIAIDDSPVGPVAIEEILARFKKGEVVANTLCWKEGMADWAPASEVPGLAARLGLDSESATGPSGAVAMGAEAPFAPPSENPSRSLDSLVRAELDALDSLARAPTGKPDFESREARNSMPPKLAPFGEAEEIPSPLTAARPPARAPSPPPRTTTAPIALYLLVGLLALLAAGALIVATVVVVRTPTTVARSSQVASAPAAAPAPVTAPPSAPEKALPEPAPPAPQPIAAVPQAPARKKATIEPTAPSPEKPAKAPPPQGRAASRGPRQPTAPPSARATRPRPPPDVATSSPATSPPAPEPASEPKRESPDPAPSPQATAPRAESVDRAFEELFGEEPAGPPETSSAPETIREKATIPPAPGWGTKPKLAESDILQVVTSHRDRIRACTDGVRVPGQAQALVLRWTIRPDGAAAAPAVITPEFRDTPLARCLSQVIGSMRFPAYSGPQMEPVELPVRF